MEKWNKILAAAFALIVLFLAILLNALVLLAVAALVGYTIYYILSIRPEKIKGERELVIKGVPTLTRTGRTTRKPLKRAKKGKQNGSKIRVRKARKQQGRKMNEK